RQREAVGGRSDHARRRLDTLGFATEEEGDGPAGVGEVERLEAAVEHQYGNLIHTPSNDTEAVPRVSTVERLRPRVRLEEEAGGKGVVRLEDELVHAREPRASGDLGDDPVVRADPRRRGDPGLEAAPDDGLVHEPLAHRERPARPEVREPRGRSRAARRAIEAGRSDHDGVAERGPRGPRGAVELDGDEPPRLLTLGMLQGELRLDGGPDPLADLDEPCRLLWLEREAERARLHQRVEVAAIGKVEGNRSQAGNRHLGVEE